MEYFNNLEFLAFDHVPRCSVWIDRAFPEFYALNFAYTGQVQWGVDGSPSRTLQAPVAWWTWPGPCFQYGCGRETSWHHYYVTFRGTRAERFFAEGLVPTTIDIQAYQFVADVESYRAEWERLFVLLSRDGMRANGKAVHCLEGLFLHLQTPAPMQSNRPFQNEITLLGNAIRGDLARQWDWRTEAQRLGMSEAHLRRLFRERLNAPPHQFLLQERMETAARLLRTTALPITRIAEIVGVPDIYHFSRLFKTHHRLAPRHYRQQMRLFYDPCQD